MLDELASGKVFFPNVDVMRAERRVAHVIGNSAYNSYAPLHDSRILDKTVVPAHEIRGRSRFGKGGGPGN